MKMQTPTPRWSIVIPAYNEEDRLPRYLTEIRAFFESTGWSVEVLVSDDGSRDSTPRLEQRSVRESCGQEAPECSSPTPTEQPQSPKSCD
jgi:cellulose synthase/poly-beta-1,6-N-acetylglucosamine synthase-like glycosyltransferase